MDKYVSRYHKFYNEVVVPKLMKELEIKNIMDCPRLEKIIVNMGVGEATQNSKLMDAAMADRSRSEERRVGKECRSRWSPYH